MNLHDDLNQLTQYSAERLFTPVKINGVQFDGTTDIIISGGSGSGSDATSINGVPITISGISSNQVLVYNGISWSNSTIAQKAVDLVSNQQIAGTKTFSVQPIIPTQVLTDNSQFAASTAFVKGQNYLTSSSVQNMAYQTSQQVNISGGSISGVQIQSTTIDGGFY